MPPSCHRIAFVLVALLLAALAAACDAASPERTAVPAGSAAATARPVTAAATAVSSPAIPLCPVPPDGVRCTDVSAMQQARVLRIVDGDTLHVELGGRDETVRLYGINAPEVGQPCAAEATARLRRLAGREVRLRPDERERDRYGRLLRYVYTTQGLSVDAALVDEGLAAAWRTDGALRGAIGSIEDAARTSGAGCLWRSM
jgi:micrococcal nuclease